MSEEAHVSPSQQTTFVFGCMRQWAFVYIAGYPKSGNKFSERGQKTHKVLEDWTNEGKPPNLGDLYGRIAYPALEYIPPPKHPGVLSEASVLWRSPRGHLFNFLKDLELPGVVSYLWDYKTTSNLSYAHTSEELLNTDPQGVTYPAHRFIVTPECQEVRSTWLYLTANPPHYCVPIKAVHQREHCLKRFDLLDQVAGVMLRHREAKTHPMAFEPNPRHCGAFGGCPFKSLCNLSPVERMMSAFAQAEGPNTENFLATIASRASQEGTPTPGAQAPAVISAPMPPPPQVQPAAQAAPAAPALPWLQQQAPAPVVAPVAPPPVMPQVATQAAPQMGLPWLQPAAPAVQPAPVVPVQAPPAIQAPPAPAAQVPTPAPVPPPAPEDKPKRKRRTKAEMEEARRGKAPAPGPTQPQAGVIDTEGEEVIEEDEYEVAEPDQIGTPAPGDRPSIGNVLRDIADEELLHDLVVAMAGNPGYAGLSSVELVSRASAIASAYKAEVGGAL